MSPRMVLTRFDKLPWNDCVDSLPGVGMEVGISPSEMPFLLHLFWHLAHVVFAIRHSVIATFRVATLTLQTRKLWLVDVATDRHARYLRPARM